MVKTIRISEKLYDEFLSHVPKGVAYSDWILERLRTLENIAERVQWKNDIKKIRHDINPLEPLELWVNKRIKKLNAHERSAVCWVVNKHYRYPASEGNEKGVLPPEEDTISILSEDTFPPGVTVIDTPPSSDYCLFSFGGFASINAARAYIEREENVKQKSELEYAIFDSYPKYADFDTFMFIDEFLRETQPEIKLKHIFRHDKKYAEVEKLVEKFVNEAEKRGIGLLPNPRLTHIYSYCFRKYEEDPNFFFTTEEFNIDSS